MTFIMEDFLNLFDFKMKSREKLGFYSHHFQNPRQCFKEIDHSLAFKSFGSYILNLASMSVK